MDKFRELDFDVLEAVQAAPARRLYFADIAAISADTKKLYGIVEKLVSRNFLTKGHDLAGAFYCMTAQNEPLSIQRVRCPACKSVRRMNRAEQMAAYCRNPECRTPSGRRRVFWLVNIDHWNRGEIRKINRVN